MRLFRRADQAQRARGHHQLDRDEPAEDPLLKIGLLGELS
jgi:hypothetical protein